MRRFLLPALVIIATAPTITAQAPNSPSGQVPGIRVVEPRPYEVVSVKPHDNAAGVAYTSILRSRPGQYHAVNTTVAILLQMVYGIRPYQVVGAPDWALKDRWEVQITAPGATMRDQAGQILKMLQDRFKLQVHTETR